jgi:hypothetical protein
VFGAQRVQAAGPPCDRLRDHALRSPDAQIDALVAKLEGYVPAAGPGPDHMGFPVQLRLRCGEGEVCLVTTLTSFATAVDVTLSELRLGAFLPADDASAAIMRRRPEALDRGTGAPTLGRREGWGTGSRSRAGPGAGG